MDFTQPWDFGDVSFTVEEKNIFVNKAVLAMSSEVFRAMFTSDFKEKKMTEIPLPDKKFDDILQLMQILHPQVDKCVDETNVAYLLPLAHEYQILHVAGQCEKYLLTQPASIHNLMLADKFCLPELRQVCIEYVKEIPYNKLAEDPEFKTVSKETVCEVFQFKLEVHEGKDPLKNVVCNLMSQPSINNYFLAEKHNVPEAYEKCLKYLKDTPLAQLKAEAGFTDLKPDTLVEVLTHKFESLRTEASHITSWGDLHETSYCSGCGSSKCKNENCIVCCRLRIEKTCEVIKKY